MILAPFSYSCFITERILNHILLSSFLFSFLINNIYLSCFKHVSLPQPTFFLWLGYFLWFLSSFPHLSLQDFSPQAPAWMTVSPSLLAHTQLASRETLRKWSKTRCLVDVNQPEMSSHLQHDTPLYHKASDLCPEKFILKSISSMF